MISSQSELHRLKSIFDHMKDVILLAGDHGRVLDANAAAVKLTGYSYEELLAKNIFELTFASQEEGLKLWQEFLKMGTQDGHFHLLCKDGTSAEVEYRAVANIQPGVHLSVMRDVTEHRRHEEMLRKAVHDLKVSNQELEQFAYVASHDLQEPLRMITSYAQLLVGRYRGKLDGDADEFLAFIQDGAARSHELINDLLEYSRVRTRGKPLELTDSEKALARAISNLKMAIDESGAVVTHDPLPQVLADDTKLTQLFQNLISNSIKFRRDASPRIHISAKLEESGDGRKRKEWFFSVKDNGIGIDPKYAERVFVIFQRLHSKSKYPGTGIGLAICKKILEYHGGRIWVEPGQSEGTTFCFTLPFVKA